MPRRRPGKFKNRFNYNRTPVLYYVLYYIAHYRQNRHSRLHVLRAATRAPLVQTSCDTGRVRRGLHTLFHFRIRIIYIYIYTRTRRGGTINIYGISCCAFVKSYIFIHNILATTRWQIKIFLRNNVYTYLIIIPSFMCTRNINQLL